MTDRRMRYAMAFATISAMGAALAAGAAAKPGVHHDKPGKNSKPYAIPGPGKGVLKYKHGVTTLTIDPALAASLAGASVTTSPVSPATGSFDFPITKARVVVKKRKGHGKGASRKTLAGYVNHVGGLQLTKTYGIPVTLSNLRINLSAGKKGSLDGGINTKKSRVRLGTLSGVSYNSAAKTISATVTLTARTAKKLNTALGLGTTLSSTTVLGTLKVVPAS